MAFEKCPTLCVLQELYIWSANAALVGNRGFGEYIDSIRDLFGSFLCVIYSWIGSNQFSECTMIYIKIRRTHRRWIYSRVSPCTVFFIAVTSDNQPACQKQSKRCFLSDELEARVCICTRAVLTLKASCSRHQSHAPY